MLSVIEKVCKIAFKNGRRQGENFSSERSDECASDVKKIDFAAK